MSEIIRVRMGERGYEKYLGPILDNPPPEIWADAEIDMRREAQTDEYKRWWLLVDGGDLLAMCAAWVTHEGKVECGHNYEFHGLGRETSAYAKVFADRQTWIIRGGYNCVTYIFDQPVKLHEDAGWKRTGEHDTSEHGHHWQQLTWQPT